MDAKDCLQLSFAIEFIIEYRPQLYLKLQS